jgi:hypothetical protein
MDSQVTSDLKLVLSNGPSNYQGIGNHEVELGFRFDELLALNPSQAQIDDILLAEHLAHAIAATPTDLLRHTQRIFFYFDRNDSDGLFAALLDLFIALGNSGSPLRERLLIGSRTHLLDEHFAVLSSWLEEGIPCEEKDLPPHAKSILSRGITGVRELVKVSDDSLDSTRDPLVEAREHMEYFQINEARGLLEAAIFENPEREELHTELVQLYQATRDAPRLQAMREKLTQLLPKLPECWSITSSQTSEGKKL